MLNKLKAIKDKFVELGAEVIKPEIISDTKTYTKLIKEYNNCEPLANAYDEMLKLTKEHKDISELIEMEEDVEMRSFYKEELFQNEQRQKELNEEVKILLLPKDENDEKNVIIEIRGGAGGDEASLFALEIMRMYQKYADRNNWQVEIMDFSETEAGGCKSAEFLIKGKGAYAKLKFESGVHRVQRVPETESQGRVHTSTITVAVLPEMEDVDIEINDGDLKIDTYRSGGAGGQNVNKTESAIRITHLPTGLVVTCQDERSQIKNKDKAMKTLKSKLYAMEQEKLEKEYAQNRKIQVGTGDRSERIRTYNFPQGRISDHRINYTAYNLTEVMEGDLDTLIQELIMADQRNKLANAEV